MEHFGVLGHSWEGASLCFREFCGHSARLGHPDHPDVTMDCISFEPLMPAWEAGDYATVRRTLATSVERLARAGAVFFACPDNTAHLALESDGERLALPGLHIVTVVADEARRAGYHKVGILGTKFTMNGPLYPRELMSRGIESAIPAGADIETVNRITFSELVHGVFTERSRSTFVDVIERLQGEGCDAVALACTEHPLLVTPDISPIPVLDSTRLLAQYAAETALGQRPLPVWWGGPSPA